MNSINSGIEYCSLNHANVIVSFEHFQIGDEFDIIFLQLLTIDLPPDHPIDLPLDQSFPELDIELNHFFLTVPYSIFEQQLSLNP